MPQRRKFVPRTRRPKRAVRRPARSKRATITRNVGGAFPDRLYTTLKYVQQENLSYTGLGAIALKQFRLNGLYDPDYSGIGHQPYGYDQLTPLYGRYLVYGCKYSCQFTNTSTLMQADVALQVRPNTTVFTTWNTLCEAQYSNKRVLGIEGGRSMQTIKGYTSIAKAFGQTKATVRTDDTFQSLVSTNPTRPPTLTIYVKSLDTATSTAVYCLTTLQYYCVFYDRVAYGGS